MLTNKKMEKISDIWFRTELELETLGSKLGLQNISHDYENYWEWAIGHLDNYHLDITRTHQIESRKLTHEYSYSIKVPLIND